MVAGNWSVTAPSSSAWDRRAKDIEAAWVYVGAIVENLLLNWITKMTLIMLGLIIIGAALFIFSKPEPATA
jgi:hypothetical protein